MLALPINIKKMSPQTITIIGAGNVGYNLTHALHQNGHKILQQYSRNPTRFEGLSNIVQSTTTDLSTIKPDADLYIIAVSDDAIQNVSNQLPKVQGIVTHTSGATTMEVLNKHKRYGIFYPLQTFTRTKLLEFSTLPLCVHSHQEKEITYLSNVARTLTDKVFHITDEQRAILHVAAIFTNNFTNHLLAIANDICDTKQVSFDILRPLMLETLNKVQQFEPRTIQTGPAIRGDEKTMQRHLNLLQETPHYQQLYQVLSNSIQDMGKGS